MKKYRKARKWAILLASVLVVDSFMGVSSPYINAYAYTERTATVHATTLNVRSGPGTTYSIVTKLTNGVSVTVINEKNASDGAKWYQIRFMNAGGQTITGYVSRSYLQFPASYTNDRDFESQMAAEGFPESYKVRLRALHAKYPQWVFRAQQTNLDWNEAVKEESRVGKSLVHTNSMSSWKSMESGAYNWDNSTWVGYDGSSWVTASNDIVKYYMDSRNFLDETNVFQFLNHTYNANKQTMEGLQTMVKGTFLSGQDSTEDSGNTDSSSGSSPAGGSGTVTGPGAATESGSGGGPGATGGSGAADGPENSGDGKASQEAPQASITRKNPQILMEYGPGAQLSDPSSSGTNVTPTGSSNYVSILMNAATQSGVNPYVLAAMILQEQGSSGTGKSISGTENGYQGYYNFYNIEAYQSGNMSAVQRGLWWSSQSGSYNRPWNSPEKSILGGALYYGNNYVKVGQDTFYLKKFNVQGKNLYKHQYMTNVQGAASEGAVYAKAYNDEMKQNGLEFRIPVYKNMPEETCKQPTGDGNPNNKLSALSIGGFVMTPTFNQDITEYNLIVDPTVSSVTVYASPLNSAASIKGTGNITLQNGNNDIKIAVAAQNGNVREYVLHVVRQNNGPTYSSTLGTGTSTGSSDNTNDQAASPQSNTQNGSSQNVPHETGINGGPGVTSPSKEGDGNAATPGGSNVTIAPDGSGNLSAQSSDGNAAKGPGDIAKTVQPVSALESAQTAQMNAAKSSSSGSGDINGDGKVDSLDVLKLQRCLLEMDTLLAGSKAAADLNGDGKVNAQDLLLLKKKILGL